MRILVVGSGAREHALVWALARHGHALLAAPGNPGIARLAACHSVSIADADGLVDLAARSAVDLVVVGPEAPLCNGLADRLAVVGIACFGPTAAGARLEASKAWSKQFFARHAIPTAEFGIATRMDEVDAIVARLGDAVVVKADGLAAGKGVVVCGGRAEARAAAERMLIGNAFGEAGSCLVIERRLSGREASIMAITDGRRFVILPPAEDHKAIFDGDHGPNTGGMGAVSPTPVVDAALLARIEHEILAPTVAGLAAEGIDYRGLLFAGLMIDADGAPSLLEYNCRFGDPEAEVVCARWADDPAAWLAGAAHGALPAGAPQFGTDSAVCVVMAAADYPASPRLGDVIAGADSSEALVFHAGTRQLDGELVTAGGRVLAVTALGGDLTAARTRAYSAVEKIHWQGVQFRRDIGARR